MGKIKDKQIDNLNEWEVALAMMDEAIEDIKLTIEYLKK